MLLIIYLGILYYVCIILSIILYSIFVIAGTVGNVSFEVTFDVGASEVCFQLGIFMDDQMENSERFRLKIVSNTERIVLDKDLEITLIIVVDAESCEFL